MKLVEYLVEAEGADPEHKDKHGYSLLALEGEWRVVQYLHKKKERAGQGQGQVIPLQLAAAAGDLGAVREMLAATTDEGASRSIDSRGAIDFNPLQLAVREGLGKVVRLPLVRGAVVMATNFHASVLHFVTLSSGNEECLTLGATHRPKAG